MSEYLFILGRASKLCQAELKAVLTREKIDYTDVFVSPEVCHISTPFTLKVDSLIKTLGGTIKIGEVFEEVKNEEQILTKIVMEIQRSNRVGREKIIFGLSAYGSFCFNEIYHLSEMVKDDIAKSGRPIRFILPHQGTSLSSVVIAKQKVSDIILVKEKEKIILAKTLTLQDFEDWGKRDFSRPAPEPHRGMLPPKVARMMVNLASPGLSLQGETLLDPFCGTGTILAEAIMLGLNVVGSDQSQEALEKTRKNLNWLISQYPNIPISTYRLLLSDATHVGEKLPPESVDAIVTEPYLGPTTEIKNLKNIVLGLEKLYLGCLRDWQKILKPQGRIVIAFPSFKIANREVFVKKPIDTCENLGYTLLAGPYQYSRPQAVVVRNIYVLKKN